MPDSAQPGEHSVPPYLLHEHEITRLIDAAGKITYIGASGQELDFCAQSLEEYFNLSIDAMRTLISLLADHFYDEVGVVYRAMIHLLQVEVAEAFSFIERELGDVQFDVVTRRNVNYRPGRVVGVRLVPPKRESNDAGSI